MLSKDWQSLRRILVIQTGELSDLVRMRVAMEQLQRSIPQAEVVLLCAIVASRLALSLPGVTEVLVHRAMSSSGFLCGANLSTNLIEVLRSENFDAAFIFPSKQMSPYALGYVCYLAGIPIRVGVSCEFGGGVLSHCVSEKLGNRDPNLSLLEAIGLATAEVA